jgi:hypothetical protein
MNGHKKSGWTLTANEAATIDAAIDDLYVDLKRIYEAKLRALKDIFGVPIDAPYQEDRVI